MQFNFYTIKKNIKFSNPYFMTKTTLFKTLLLSVILIYSGIVSMAVTVTHTFVDVSGTIDSNIAFTTDKNEASSVPAFNTTSNELRLYYSSTGNGCSLTLTPSNGAVITDVKLTASSATYTPTVKYNVDGAADATAVLATTVYSITGINASTSLKLRNANTTNTQLRVKTIEVTYTISSFCTSPNLAFPQSSMNKLVTDASFTQTASSLNGTTPITYSSTNTGVATVNENTGEVTIVGSGNTDIVATQAAGTHNTVAYCAATASYTLSVSSAAPTITITEVTVPDMVAYAGQTDMETINISGINLSGNINLSVTGTNADQFSLSTNSISQSGGTAANTVVTVYYSPSSAGSHTATLNISSTGATSVTRTLNGTSTWAPLTKPVATEATGISNTTFTANWEAVAGATQYQLDVTSMTSGGGSSAPVLTENFANFTAGQPNATPDATDISAILDTFTQTAGWTGLKVYQAGGSVKVGTSSALGYLVTPAINLSANGGQFNISFKAMAWSTDATTLKIYVNDVLANTLTGLGNDATYTLKPFSVDLTGGNSATKIRFEGAQAAKGRFFLDDFVISQGGAIVETPIAGSPFTVIGENSKSFTGLTAGTEYKYTVTAKNDHVISEVSNKISVTTTTGTGINSTKNELFVSVNNGTITFNAEAGKNIEVYNSVGQKMIVGTSVEGLNKVTLTYRGVAFVKVGNQTTKIIL